MLIKSVDSKKRAVAFEPNELVHAAIVHGLKEHGGIDWIYWSPKHGLKTDNVAVSKNPQDGSWEATATGVCLVGKTKVATDQFYDAKRCSFKVAYQSAKDDLGLPDIKVTSFDFAFDETNPSKGVGPTPPKSEPKKPVTKGEVAAQTSTKKEKAKAEEKHVEPEAK